MGTVATSIGLMSSTFLLFQITMVFVSSLRKVQVDPSYMYVPT